jgi:hypothetical protein
MLFRSGFFKQFPAAVGAIVCLAISSAASAHIVSMTGFVGLWYGPTGGPSGYTNSGVSQNPYATWGDPTGTHGPFDGQSGYLLNLAPPPPTPIDQTVAPPPNTPPFLIGTFTHVNEPIGGTAITGINLEVSFDILVDGVDQGIHNFFFHFAHDETSNGLDPCPYGGANFQGVNINGCADSVTVSFIDVSDSFSVGGVAYTFNLLGFDGTDCTSGINSQFLTVEGQENPAALCAEIRTLSSIQAPEPGTLALLGLGLIGLTFVRRRLS